MRSPDFQSSSWNVPISPPHLCTEVMNLIPVGLVIWQLEDSACVEGFRLIAMNQTARQVLQVSPEIDPQQTQIDPFPGFLKIEAPAVYAEVLATKQPKDLGEVRYRGGDGHVRIFSLQAFPLEERRLGCLFEDVSDRKYTEENLRKSEERLALHLQQTPLAVIEWNLAFQVVDWNPAAERLFGFSRTDVVGRSLLDLLVPLEHREEVRHGWVRLTTTRLSRSNLHENLRRDGTTILCEWYSTPLVDEDGRIIGVASMLQDVTRRRQAEAAVAASEMRYRRLFEASPNGILILNGRTGEITDINPYLLKLLGYHRAELLGKKLWDLGLHKDRAASKEVFTTLQQQGFVRYDHLPLQTQQGRLIEVEFVNNVYAVAGETVIQCSVRDISERKRYEAERQRFTTQLERSNRELQDFASVASHDLQEPLRKIQAFGDRLQSRCQNALDDEGRDYLARMQNAAKRMQTLINDLLTFSRVTTRAQPFIPVNLNQVFQEVLSDLEVSIQTLNAQIQAHPLPTLDADPLQMRQLFQNLLSNALKFHAEAAPVIQISVRYLHLKSTGTPSEIAATPDLLPGLPPGLYCQIWITDNGIGFDQKYCDRIFTVFQRLHGRSEYEGTGIGLAICRKVVERHHGRITASSTFGHGATFTVTLPVHQLSPSSQ